MRWCSYRSPTDGQAHVGLVVDDHVHGHGGSETLLDVVASGYTQDFARREPVERVPRADAQLLAPIQRPPSMRDFMAFENHVVTSMAAMGGTVDPVWYAQPVFYFTNPAAVLGPTQDNRVAPGCKQWDYELEVAAVLGSGGSDLSPAEAEQCIAGYTIFCDWSARDLQGVEMKVGLGPAKGKDTATSLGPYLVTPDELEDRRSGNGYYLAMSTTVNGRPYSSGTWADLYWSFGEMIAYASRGTQLQPGDIIGSGTVGTGCILELSRVHGTEAYPWLQPGDEVRLEVERLGAITSTVTQGAAVVPLR